MKLKPGPNRKDRLHAKNTRGMAFCGLGAFVGIGKTQRAHVYTAASSGRHPRDATRRSIRRGWRVNSRSTCARSTADVSGSWTKWISRGRHRRLPWRQDDLCRRDDRGRDDGPDARARTSPTLIYRNSNWIWHAGKPVHLLREPGGTVWVMQEYTKDVDPSLTLDNLHQVGSKLKNLPKGWTFETKVLTKDLSLDTARGGGWAAIIRDELHCTYQGCGYGADTSANYVP